MRREQASARHESAAFRGDLIFTANRDRFDTS
jgi:hypothetical protein